MIWGSHLAFHTLPYTWNITLQFFFHVIQENRIIIIQNLNIFTIIRIKKGSFLKHLTQCSPFRFYCLMKKISESNAVLDLKTTRNIYNFTSLIQNGSL